MLLRNFSEGLAAESRACPLDMALQWDSHLKEETGTCHQGRRDKREEALGIQTAEARRGGGTWSKEMAWAVLKASWRGPGARP